VSLHPSPYALDLAALGGEPPVEVARHLETCPTCAGIVAARRAAEALPAWAEKIRVAPAPGPVRTLADRAISTARRWRWWLLPLPAAATLAALVFALRPGPPGDLTDELREKGAPKVTVYVKRGDQVATWDGHSSIQPGDRLRLGVRGAGFANLSVASVEPGADPMVLFNGPVEPKGETLLPLSFRVDDGGGSEDLSIILSSRPVLPAAHARTTVPPTLQGEWTTRLHLPKETAP
jgi:hypothetical protein